MRQIILIDNGMFDDGSFECHNFWVSDQDGSYHIGATSELIQHLKPLIMERMAQKEKWINLRHLPIIYGGLKILEVTWD